MKKKKSLAENFVNELNKLRTLSIDVSRYNDIGRNELIITGNDHKSLIIDSLSEQTIKNKNFNNYVVLHIFSYEEFDLKYVHPKNLKQALSEGYSCYAKSRDLYKLLLS